MLTERSAVVPAPHLPLTARRLRRARLCSRSRHQPNFANKWLCDQLSMELLNPGLELFGAQGVDFPDDTESLFSERLPRVLDCELSKEISSLLDIQQNWDQRPPSDAGAENDSVFSDDSFKSESEQDMRTAGMERLACLPSEDDMLSDSLNLNGEPAEVDGVSEVFLGLEPQLSLNAKDRGGSPGPDQGYASQEEVIEVCHQQHQEEFLVEENQEQSQGESMPGNVEPNPSAEEGLEERRDSLVSEDLHSRLFADLNFDDMLSVGREELEEVDRVSNLISGAECDFSEQELRTSTGSATSVQQVPPLTPLLESQELDLKEEELDCDLGQFNFNLALTESSREKETVDKLSEDLQRITEELTVSPSSLWAECFPEGLQSAASTAASEYDDLLDSILSSPEHSLDPEYFNSDYFDIDSVDPTCLHQVKEESPCEDQQEEEQVAKVEVDQVKVKEEEEEEGDEGEEEEVHSSRLDHDYSLPPSSSLLITPPHSSEDESEAEDKFKGRLCGSHQTKSTTHKLVKTHQQRSNSTGATQIIKFQHKKDLKFVMSFQVKSDELKSTSPRSLLKSKLVGREGRRVKELQREEERRSSSSLHSNNGPQKTAKELVREIIEKRSRMDLKTKREQVKSMKRKLRLEGKTEVRGAKHRCLTDLRSKPDLKKYRKFEEERELHNSMERQRRVELKDAYDSLKERIPSIATEDKVSKLMILNTASDFCRGMEGTLSKLRRERQREVERSRKLRLHLASLQVRLP